MREEVRCVQNLLGILWQGKPTVSGGLFDADLSNVLVQVGTRRPHDIV